MDMAEPNQFINMASTYVRGFKEGWKENAHEQIINACNTSWGKKVFQGNPTMEGIIRVLNQKEISVEERVQLISDIENMHTFSNSNAVKIVENHLGGAMIMSAPIIQHQ